jgi:hypothetical protein
MPCHTLKVELIRTALEYTLVFQILFHREMSKPRSGVRGQTFTVWYHINLLMIYCRGITGEGLSL